MVAFSKPMRIRDASGNVVPYPGLGPGAAPGTVMLEIPSAGQDIDLDGGAWLGAPGGAPDGYLRHAGDAFAVDFTLPDTIDVAAAATAVPFLNPQDLAQMVMMLVGFLLVLWRRSPSGATGSRLSFRTR